MPRIEPGLGGKVVVRPSREVFIDSDGQKRAGIHMTVTPEIMEQFRQGYRCIACKIGVQDEPFPERCQEPWCRFPMRKDQLRMIQFEDQGEETLWPEHEGDRERDEWEARTGLWLPNN